LLFQIRVRDYNEKPVGITRPCGLAPPGPPSLRDDVVSHRCAVLGSNPRRAFNPYSLSRGARDSGHPCPPPFGPASLRSAVPNRSRRFGQPLGHLSMTRTTKKRHAGHCLRGRSIPL